MRIADYIITRCSNFCNYLAANKKSMQLFSCLLRVVIASVFCEAIQEYLWIAAPYKQHKARNDGNRTE